MNAAGGGPMAPAAGVSWLACLALVSLGPRSIPADMAAGSIMPYRFDPADCQRRRQFARADAVMTGMPGIADKFTQSAQSRRLWPGIANFDEATAPARDREYAGRAPAA